MTDRELQYIISIAEEHNVTHAAEKLHISQPSLTQTLRRIEEELGTPLFTRRKYGLDPTTAGECYLKMARDILARMQQFHEDFQQLVNPLFGKIAIGASWYNTLLLLSEVIPEISTRFPAVEISLVEKGTNELMELFLSRSLNLILAHEYPSRFPFTQRQFAKDIRSECLVRERFCLVAHERYRLDEGVSDLSGLEGMPFICFNDAQRIRRITDFAFDNASVSVKKVVKTQSFPGAMDLAERGVGLAVLPEFYVRKNIPARPSLRFFIIDQAYDAYWFTYVYYRRGDYPDRLTEEILPVLRRASASLQDKAD